MPPRAPEPPSSSGPVAAERSLELIAELGTEGHIRYASPSHHEVLGYAAGEIVGQSVFDLAHPDDRARLEQFLDSAGRCHPRREPAEATFRLRRRDGSFGWFESSGRSYRISPAEVRSVVVSRDVTDRKRTEVQLARSQSELRATESRLEQAVRERRVAEKSLRDREAQLFHAQKMEALGLLAGGISHDFNNLLTVILGHAEMLREQRGRPQPDLSGTDAILAASERAMALTRQLLTFSRKQVIRPRIIDLNEVVTDTLGILDRLIGENIDLEVDLHPGPGAVRADPGQISQIVMNLALNARDAMPDGGRLVMRTRIIERLEEDACSPGPPPGAYVRLRVTDTGCGIEEASQERIFEPFFTTKDAGGGTGLGLSTVYGIARQNGGLVRVRSRVGAGASFEVDLPHVEGAVENEPHRSEPPPRRGHETVLLVEDDASVRQLARRILASYGYQVVAARDGHDALKAAEGLGPELELLVTDVVMPGLGGPELARSLRARHPGLRVVYTSGYAQNSADLLSDLEPGSRFLSKPFHPTALTRLVGELLAENGGQTGEEAGTPTPEEESA